MYICSMGVKRKLEIKQIEMTLRKIARTKSDLPTMECPSLLFTGFVSTLVIICYCICDTMKCSLFSFSLRVIPLTVR